MGGQVPEGWPVVVHVSRPAEIAGVLDAVSVGRGRPVVVLVGGAGGMDDDAVRKLEEVLRRAVLPVIDACRATVIDGGTDSGVMRAVGRARSEAGASFPLVGVAARGTVALPETSSATGAAGIDMHHTHLLLVPGTEWGDEAPWIVDVADAVAGDRPSVTLLVNGGEIAYDDADRSLDRGRPVVVLAGTGRTADAIADAAAGRSGDARGRRIARSGLTRIVPIDDLAALQTALVNALRVADCQPVATDQHLDEGEVR
jgi:hypothetical protein